LKIAWKITLAKRMATLYGYIDRITYYNEENGFVVAKLQEKGKKGLTTIVGNLAAISPGESFKLTGRWVHNKKFGEQFQVETFETIMPATALGIRKYLGSGLIKGIGPVLADRMVDKFGPETLDVIEKEPERLSEVDGIGSRRIEMILHAWEEQREIKEIMIFLQGHGVGIAYAAKIYKHYGKRSIEVVRENPYQLAQEITGIGFISADKIAQNIGFDPNSILRAKAGLVYALSELTEEGHVYYPESQLVHRAVEMLKIDPNVITKALEVLLKEKEVFREQTESEEGHGVYLAPFYIAETGIARRLRNLQESPSNIRPIRSEKAIEWVEEKLGITLAQGQKEAIDLAARSKLLVITGGPGTGKTTIILAILEIFKQLRLRILLAAPTGRAAKRMSEAARWDAKTIHRLLEYSPKKRGFMKNENDSLEADVVIIDEASMVDTLLMDHLLKAIPYESHLILVGDVDQLPSVGPGNVLKDIIDSGSFTVVRLTEIFRQAQKSMIVVNAHRVNQGEFPLLKNSSSEGPTDFHFIEEETPEAILGKILAFCHERIPKQFGFHPIRGIQVMTPMHRGVIGVTNLNAELQKELNPGAFGITFGGKTFTLGDKVMQIINNYDKDVFNGDIGWVSKINQEDREIIIDFDGRLISYDYGDLDEVVLAYAISVHKAQGSEYPAVILPLSTQHYLLLQRNLLYTAMTRARRLVVLIGTKKALAIAIRNNQPQRRYTHLAQRLKKWSTGLLE
jgi:exodeoxyribonuclease V alpha subunit